MLDIHQFSYGDDNYGVLLHCRNSGETAMVDAGDAEAGEQALARTGWSLSQIWITHHHGDHTAGLTALKAAHNAQVIGPATGKSQVAGLDQQVADGEHFTFASREVRVLTTPGHTLDMTNFYLPSERLVFTGDTLFAMGCGRLFEGDAPMMWASLNKLMALPDDTTIYCSHEYTTTNATFALSVDPKNQMLVDRAQQVSALRAAGEPTVPTTMSLEKATNPFLRANDPSIRLHLNMPDDTDAAVFAEIRHRKDSF